MILADFGVSYIVDEKKKSLNEYCGTVGYIAPEIVLEQEYSFGVDIWSAGAVMYECLTRTQPFVIEEDELKQIFQAWSTEKSKVLEFDKLSSLEQSLVSKMLRLQGSRPTVKDLLKEKYFQESGD